VVSKSPQYAPEIHVVIYKRIHSFSYKLKGKEDLWGTETDHENQRKRSG